MIETPLRTAVAVPASFVTDNLVDAGAAVRLGIFDVAGQRVDDIAGEMGSIRRCQRDMFLALEVVVQDQFLIVIGNDQIDAGPLEIAVEK